MATQPANKLLARLHAARQVLVWFSAATLCGLFAGDSQVNNNLPPPAKKKIFVLSFLNTRSKYKDDVIQKLHKIFQVWKLYAMGSIYFIFCRLYPSSPSDHGSVWLLPVISLFLTNTVHRCGLAYPYDWRGFVGTKKRRPLKIQSSLVVWLAWVNAGLRGALTSRPVAAAPHYLRNKVKGIVYRDCWVLNFF